MGASNSATAATRLSTQPKVDDDRVRDDSHLGRGKGGERLL